MLKLKSSHQVSKSASSKKLLQIEQKKLQKEQKMLAMKVMRSKWYIEPSMAMSNVLWSCMAFYGLALSCVTFYVISWPFPWSCIAFLWSFMAKYRFDWT